MQAPVLDETTGEDRDHNQPLVPPLNFALVEAGIYRSGHPNPKNYRFLKKLGLKSILFVAKEDYPQEMLAWLQSNGIAFYQYRTAGNKVASHRVGCLVGCLRKLQNWSLSSILDEYKRFAAKQNIADQEFIELFAAPVVYKDAYRPGWLAAAPCAK
ncbi:protein-tyrosine phosphatase-like protein [Thamnocephalis sphaerospora]|uniref:Protein-tyrosine phosphatase-like protein n=1 Tax=Thamnocephalis sphaerospora TaxID=78915 RepID=A0A4P9XPX9_9FUNG|nr:protein-tyrosine phosphatase-like protein [Thamnocephalis sphaerospora]|eukprot:RKP07320.1 protein-tyrosine phosphatase-like protein [Thamnocephalis sphaerospora]